MHQPQDMRHIKYLPVVKHRIYTTVPISTTDYQTSTRYTL